MRPRISDASARGAYERTGGQDAAAHCAVMEARSILADTEPIRPGYSMADRLYRGPFLMVEPMDAERALAASLRAFDAMSIGDLAALQSR